MPTQKTLQNSETGGGKRGGGGGGFLDYKLNIKGRADLT